MDDPLIERPLVPPTLSGGEVRSPTKVLSVGEDGFVTFVKRVYSQHGLLVMFANTIISVFSISAAVSLIPDDNFIYMRNFCDYGDSGAHVLVQCPYTPSPIFQTFVTVWSVYFSTFFAYRYYETSIYETDDLRFYVYCDKFNSSVVNRAMVAVGLILTFISFVGALYFVIHNGTTDSIGAMVVFMAVNCYNLIHMGLCKFPVLGRIEMSRHEAFRAPVCINTEPMWSLFNGNGMFLSHYAVFDYISDALNAVVLTSDDSHLRALGGDVEQIKQVMRVINPLTTRR